jgi:predicted enzyme related to lactoylglutathione lyase
VNEEVIEKKEKSRIILGKPIQVRLVSDLQKSQSYYRDCLGCSVDDWGHAKRDEVSFILQQAVSSEDVKPNVVSAKRPNYPTEWIGPDYGWDTFLHIGWEELDQFVEEVRVNGGNIGIEPFTGAHGDWEFKNAHILDPDGYNIVLGAMRKIK